MANPQYGQNKADGELGNGMYVVIGPTVSIAADDVANGDLIGGVNLPANTMVHKCQLETIVAASGGTAADTEIDVGTAGDPDMFLDDVNGDADAAGLGTAGQLVSAGGTVAIGAEGYFLTNPERISIKIVAESSTAGSCRLVIWASSPEVIGSSL